MPYSVTYLNGLHLGFSREDLRTMPYGELVCFIRAYGETVRDNEQESDEPKQGTRDDIVRLFY